MAIRESFRNLLALIVLAALGLAMGTWLFRQRPARRPLPAALRCDSLSEPLGIDVLQPRLSWQLADAGRGTKQFAYEIRVAGSVANLSPGSSNVWDSGRVESSDSVNVAYAGPALASRKRYYWQVRVWDQPDHASDYSQPSWWEMGLLSAEDWKAKWISRDAPLLRGDYESHPQWIWAADDKALTKPTVGKREFREIVTLASQPKAAILYITAKDNVEAWVNGKNVLEESPVDKFSGPHDSWSYFREVPVANLVPGTNSIAVEATVLSPDSPGDPNFAAVIAMLRVEMQDGTVQRFVSGPGWKTNTGKVPAVWFEDKFDDSKWPHVTVVAEIGDQKFGIPWPAAPVALYRREFQATKKVQSARIYSTALGTYQLFLNGNRVGDDVLAPGWTDYRKRLPYQVYDVTTQIRAGNNAIGAILADGWYAGALSWLKTRFNFGAPPVRFIAQLEIDYSDGSHDSVWTDRSWKSAPSAILSSDLYDGETYDATREQPGWDVPGFSEKSWEGVAISAAPKTVIVAQDFQPIRVHEILKSKSVTNPAAGAYVFDLGQNMVGWARLHVSGPKGTKIRLRFGEVLQPDGELYTENLRSAFATEKYVLGGQPNEVIEPHFTFHGFRYVELSGFPGVPSKDAIEGIAFYTSAPFTAQLHTGNSLVNQLWSNILWGQRGNFLSVPTDCPQRDERLGWMGDAEVFWRAASFNADLAAFSHKFTTDIRDAQSPSGAYADVSPRLGSVIGESVAGWADAGIVIPWTAYVQYRDVRILEENWSAMEKWMDYLQSANPDYLWLKKRGNDYADWLAIGSETPKDLIATAYWAYDATLMRRMALALGKQADAQKYGELFEKIRAAFQKSFVKPDGIVGSGSQTSYVLALHMNLLSPAQRSLGAQKLVDDIVAHEYHLTTGFLGTPYILLELSDSGHSDTAYKLLLQTTFPSWGYMIEHGATTMWERWNGDQMLADPGMNSFNHYAYGAVAEWLYRYAAGIDTSNDDTGFHRIVLHPQFSRELGEMSASYDSVYGPIYSEWKVTGATTTWSVGIPANTSALLQFPVGPQTKITENGKDIGADVTIKFVKTEGSKSIYEIGSGSYSFTIGQ
jgi:alpha-L-rhamnosidase